AWAARPDILFLDEPTANLDPTGQKEVEALLASFRAEGMTLLMSTHNLGQAKRLANRVVYLDHGRLLADQATADFFSDHADDRTGLFLKGELRWDL
ncbi:phosphate ABC transporter ATP-binding protein, partial [Paucibacter sp. XJ19-41]|nr:phosphate ABC transporter ATP-binding protein [Paucibacter sp. XJ19-41]